MKNPGKRAEKRKSQRPDTADAGHVSVAEETIVVPPINHRVAYSEDVSFTWNADELLEVQQSPVCSVDSDNDDVEITRPSRTLLTGSTPANDKEEDRGVDPYNTGRFNSTSS